MSVDSLVRYERRPIHHQLGYIVAEGLVPGILLGAGASGMLSGVFGIANTMGLEPTMDSYQHLEVFAAASLYLSIEMIRAQHRHIFYREAEPAAQIISMPVTEPRPPAPTLVEPRAA